MTLPSFITKKTVIGAVAAVLAAATGTLVVTNTSLFSPPGHDMRMQILDAGPNVWIFLPTNATSSHVLEASADAGSNWYNLDDARFRKCYTNSTGVTNCYFIVIHPKGPPTEIYRLRKGF